METPDDEVHAAGRVVSEVLGGVVRIVADVHAAVTRRVSSVLPRPASTVAGLQGAMADGIYRTVDVAHRHVPLAVTGVVGVVAPSAGPRLSASPTGQAVLSALGGVWGDHLAARHRPLAVHTAVRTGHADLALDPAAVAVAFPGATSRLAVFLHGLAESDVSWRWKGAPTYGDLLRAQGITPVYLRYNSGLSLTDNGAAVSALLERLVGTWPVPVEELHVVGHSMGGLVAHAACHRGRLDGLAWSRVVRTVVTLGTPYLGAPLAQAVDRLETLLSLVPETRPLGRVLATRSAGVRDLEAGARLPVLPDVRYRLVAATVTARLGHPVGRIVGDGLVRSVSAGGHRGPGRALLETLVETASAATATAAASVTGPLADAVPDPLADAVPDPDAVHVGGAHHFSLLNHPRLGVLLCRWLGPAETRSLAG